MFPTNGVRLKSCLWWLAGRMVGWLGVAARFYVCFILMVTRICFRFIANNNNEFRNATPYGRTHKTRIQSHKRSQPQMFGNKKPFVHVPAGSHKRENVRLNFILFCRENFKMINWISNQLICLLEIVMYVKFLLKLFSPMVVKICWSCY